MRPATSIPGGQVSVTVPFLRSRTEVATVVLGSRLDDCSDAEPDNSCTEAPFAGESIGEERIEDASDEGTELEQR